MLKKGVLVLIIVVFAAGGAFAQRGSWPTANNTITVDIAPTIACFAIGPLGSMVGSVLTADSIKEIKTVGFGVAAQYERQLIRQLSVAGRVVFGIPEVGFTYNDSGITADPYLKMTSLAAEAHVRFFPFGDTFFLDGMAGYANLTADLSGSVVYSGTKQKATAKESSDYLKFGGKLGWRIGFGYNGGFTFEPSIGWYLGMPLGKALGEKVSDSLSKQLGGNKVPGIEEAFNTLETYAFIGGPRLSLAFGYRF